MKEIKQDDQKGRNNKDWHCKNKRNKQFKKLSSQQSKQKYPVNSNIPTGFSNIYATNDDARVISSVGAWKQKTYNRGLIMGKLNKTAFNYIPVMFHFGNRNRNSLEYLRQRKFNMGNDYTGGGITEKQVMMR